MSKKKKIKNPIKALRKDIKKKIKKWKKEMDRIENSQYD